MLILLTAAAGNTIQVRHGNKLCVNANIGGVVAPYIANMVGGPSANAAAAAAAIIQYNSIMGTSSVYAGMGGVIVPYICQHGKDSHNFQTLSFRGKELFQLRSSTVTFS